MAGIIITVLALVTNLPLQDLAVATAWLSCPRCWPWPPVSPGSYPSRMRLAPAACGPRAGLLVSLVALAAVLTARGLSGMVGGLALMATLLLWPRRRNFSRQLGRDLLPFACIFVPLLLVNTMPCSTTSPAAAGCLPCAWCPFTDHPDPCFSAYLYLFLALGVALGFSGGSIESRCWRQG